MYVCVWMRLLSATAAADPGEGAELYKHGREFGFKCPKKS